MIGNILWSQKQKRIETSKAGSNPRQSTTCHVRKINFCSFFSKLHQTSSHVKLQNSKLLESKILQLFRIITYDDDSLIIYACTSGEIVFYAFIFHVTFLQLLFLKTFHNCLYLTEFVTVEIKLKNKNNKNREVRDHE